MDDFDYTNMRWDSDPDPLPTSHINGFTDRDLNDRVSWSATDLVIDALAQENAELREALSSVRSDVRQYRGIVSALLAELHRMKDGSVESSNR